MRVHGSEAVVVHGAGHGDVLDRGVAAAEGDPEQAHGQGDAQNGAHFVFGRVPIGANDYTLSRYTDDEMPNDTTMASFSIARDQEYLIPYIQTTLAINPHLHL